MAGRRPVGRPQRPLVPRQRRRLGLRDAPVRTRRRVDRNPPLRPGHRTRPREEGRTGRDRERTHRCRCAGAVQRQEPAVTAQLLTEALATLWAIRDALLLWILAGAGVVSVCGLGVVAGGVWMWQAARSRWTAAYRPGRGGAGSGCLDPAPGPSDANVGTRDRAEGPCAAIDGRQGGPQGAGGGFHAPSHPDASEARTAPSWARTDKGAA